jgi:hypothetical protein
MTRIGSSGSFTRPASEEPFFVESLARYRRDLQALALMTQVRRAHEPIPSVLVPADWRSKRGIARIMPRPSQRWLDLRASATRERLREELAPRLLELGLADLDLGSVVGPRRALTQTIARWAYDRGVAGLVYHSRFDAGLTCWALFERAVFETVGGPEPITPSDPDLLAVARLFSMSIEPDPNA